MDQEFQRQVLSELAAIRRELRELRGLQVEPPPVPTGPGESSIFEGVPDSLRKRLQPLLQNEMPPDPRQRAQWVLEITENVDDYLRYEGDEWVGSAPFLQRLQDLQDRVGLERLIPQEGEYLDDRKHLILQTLPNPERRDEIARCARPGFVHLGEMLRRAEVVAYL